MRPSALIALLLLGIAFFRCGSSPPPGTVVIALTDSIVNPLRSNVQVYWTVADSARWAATVAAADTLIEEGDRYKMRSDAIWYEWRLTGEELRANQPYPGWERRIDSVSRSRNVIRMLDNNRVTADIPAADVVIGRDSFRIGIIRVTGKAFSWQEFNAEHPDYLILTNYRNGSVPIVMDQDNIGGISRKTVFRVGRRYFVLKSVSEDRRELTIEETEVGREFPLVAELDLYYKQVPVLDLDSTRTTIRHTAGRKLAVYFTATFGPARERLHYVDSLYRALPAEEQAKLEIAVVFRNAFLASVARQVAEDDIRLPVYVATDKTCRRLNCHPWLPYFVGVTERGRISSFYGYQHALENYLEMRLGEGTSTENSASGT